MSRRERDKGVKGEREVRHLIAARGFTVRGLEGSGDHLAIGHGLVLHVECKRQETLRLPLWTRQAANEAPAGAVPLVAFRQSRRPWEGAMPESAVLELLRQADYSAGIHYALFSYNGAWWVRGDLGRLLDGLMLGAALARPQEALS